MNLFSRTNSSDKRRINLKGLQNYKLSLQFTQRWLKIIRGNSNIGVWMVYPVLSTILFSWMNAAIINCPQKNENSGIELNSLEDDVRVTVWCLSLISRQAYA